MIEYPEMVTMRELSKRTGLSYDAIRKMLLRGEVVYIKVGKKFLVNAGKFVEYLNGGTS